jgi:hypothetical protein
MPQKKEATPREHAVAKKKNHPTSKEPKVKVAQNGETNPKESAVRPGGN